MSKMAVNDGIHTIVATPHTLDGTHINPIDAVISRVADLGMALSENKLDLALHAGADVHFSRDLVKKVESGVAGTINDMKKYMLLEMPYQSFPARMKDEVFDLKLNGITPVITHPERHMIFQRDPEALRELVSIGALCQVTAMSITGFFGEVVTRCVKLLLKSRLVHVIATDAHSSNQRPPILTEAVEAAAQILGNYQEAERMVTEVPAMILSGSPVEP